MKKLMITALLTVATFAHADFGSSFGGAMTGSVVGGALSGAMQPKTQVVYVNDDGEQINTSTRKNKRKMQALQDENDSLRDQLETTNKRLKALEEKVK